LHTAGFNLLGATNVRDRISQAVEHKPTRVIVEARAGLHRAVSLFRGDLRTSLPVLPGTREKRLVGFSQRVRRDFWKGTRDGKPCTLTVASHLAPFGPDLIHFMYNQARSNRKEFYGATAKTAAKIQK
jgi:hypothetical protein